MRKDLLASLICFVAFVTNTYAQLLPDNPNGSYSISGYYHYGFIIAHRSTLVPLQQDHLKGFELALSKSTFGNKLWQQYYNYPSIGIKYLWFNLGNNEQLGTGQAAVPFLSFKFSKSQHTFIGMSFGWGLGIIQKPFNTETNYKNIAIGSRLNGVINISAELKTKIFSKTFISGGLSLTHFSNGSVTVPNLGVNLSTVKIGITRNFGAEKKINKDSLPSFIPHFRNSVYAAAGIKQIYPVEGPYYYIIAFSAARLKQYSEKSAAGLGLDIHYDDSSIKKLKNDSINATNFTYGVRSGINASYEMLFSDFSIMFQMGGYFYNRLKSDGIFYHRIGLRYQFSKHYFGCINLKTHFAKADFFEWGLGTKF